MAAPADPRSVRRDVGLAVGAGALWLLAVWVASGWAYWQPLWIESYWWAGAWLVVPLALRRAAPGAALWVTAVVYPLTYVQLTQGNGLQSDFHIVPVLVAAFVVTRAAALPEPACTTAS